MKNRTKKWLLVAGCLVICAVMIGVIGNRFGRDPVQDDPALKTEVGSGGVVVDAGTDAVKDNKDDITVPVVVKPDKTIPTDNNAESGAVFTGTEQTIQSDPVKPEYDEAALGDPNKTPDGVKVDTPLQDELKDKDNKPTDTPVTPPPPTEKPSGNGGSNNGNSGGSSGGLPGFNNVPNGGENKGTYNDDMRENGNKIGIMGN